MRVALPLCALLLTVALPAQDPTFERVDLRVLGTVRQGVVEVDRGSNDAVKVGDLVQFFPRGSGILRGTVKQVAERSAVVELNDPRTVPVAGTRGEVLVPRSRIAPPTPVQEPPRQQPPQQPPQPGQPQRETPEHPPWTNKDTKWRPGSRLLAETLAIRPEKRETRISGRAYLIGDLVWDTEEVLENTFGRLGTNIGISNPFGAGGDLQVDGELNYRTEFETDEPGGDLLLRRASYTHGGTRFAADRVEMGRFLQFGMPEFGFLDGIEWTRRMASGDRFGVSVGVMPEPDEDFDTGQDLQFAAYYLWTADENDELTIGAGFHKSFHNGKSDRDLLIVKMRKLPRDAWQLNATAWVDFYYGSDDVKGTGVELTQAIASANRRWDNGNTLDFSYSYFRFPELLRNGEFIPVLPTDLVDNRYHRLSADSWMRWGESTRFHVNLTGFQDEDSAGGATDVGLEFESLLQEAALTDISVFANTGQHVSVIGGRLQHSRLLDNGRWDLLYEIAHHHLSGYGDDADDIIQHRLRYGRTWFWASGWDLTVHGEVRVYDDEFALIGSVYLQRSF